MVIIRIFFSLAWIIALSLAPVSCGECVSNTFQFTVDFSVRPVRDSLNVGDTLWLESTTPTGMFDSRTNKTIDFVSATNFGGGITINTLLGPNNLGPAVHNFDFVLVKGDLVPSPNALDVLKGFKYAEEVGEYKLRFGMVCKDKGVYGLTLSAAANVYSPKFGSCNRASIYLKIEDGTSKHLNYLQDTYYLNQTIPDPVKETSYCFVVK
jgi:hypothetical protein